MIGEVMKVLTSEIVATGTIEPGAPQAQLRRQLEARGLTDDDVRRGRVFVVRTLIYWNNTISGITRDELSPQAAAEGLDVQPGNVVEMRLGHSPAPCRNGFETSISRRPGSGDSRD